MSTAPTQTTANGGSRYPDRQPPPEEKAAVFIGLGEIYLEDMTTGLG
jgi:hypothetical protein